MARARLRVAVPQAVTELPTSSGIGRWWINTLAELRHDVRLNVVGQPARRRGWRRVVSDVWLSDASLGATATDLPTVTFVHEAAWKDRQLRAFLEPEFLELVETATDAAVRGAARVLAASESTRRQVIETYGVPAGQVHAVPPGIDHRVFRPGAPGGAALVERHGGNSHAPYLLFVASLHPRKNLAALRAATTGLARRGFPHLLVVVGAPAYDRPDSSALVDILLSPLEDAPGRLVSIPFGLSDAELAGLMAGADALCLPSFMEGLGFPVVEAMACGTAPVVSDRGALPELVGEAGVITSPDARSIEDGLAALLADDDRRAMIAAAAHRRASSFSWPRTAAAWLAVLQAAAG